MFDILIFLFSLFWDAETQVWVWSPQKRGKGNPAVIPESPFMSHPMCFQGALSTVNGKVISVLLAQVD